MRDLNFHFVILRFVGWKITQCQAGRSCVKWSHALRSADEQTGPNENSSTFHSFSIGINVVVGFLISILRIGCIANSSYGNMISSSLDTRRCPNTRSRGLASQLLCRMPSMWLLVFWQNKLTLLALSLVWDSLVKESWSCTPNSLMYRNPFFSLACFSNLKRIMSHTVAFPLPATMLSQLGLQRRQSPYRHAATRLQQARLLLSFLLIFFSKRRLFGLPRPSTQFQKENFICFLLFKSNTIVYQ